MKAFLQEYGAQCAGFPDRNNDFHFSNESCPTIIPNSRRGAERNSSFSRNGREDRC